MTWLVTLKFKPSNRTTFIRQSFTFQTKSSRWDTKGKSYQSTKKIREGKLQHDVNKKAIIISALSSSKVDKYEYLTGE